MKYTFYQFKLLPMVPSQPPCFPSCLFCSISCSLSDFPLSLFLLLCSIRQIPKTDILDRSRLGAHLLAHFLQIPAVSIYEIFYLILAYQSSGERNSFR